MKSDSSTKPPAEPKRKRAVVIKEAEAGRPQPPWLRNQGRKLPPPTTSEETFERPAGLPRLLSKAEVCAIAGCSFPTLWSAMRAGQFPRSRVVGGKSMWLSDEVGDWLRRLPRRLLKGDEVKP